jgi:hypothetical protein
MVDFIRNLLKIKNNSTHDQNIINIILGENFQLQNTFPMPENTQNKKKWCKENWGCASEIYIIDVTTTNNITNIIFESEYCYPEIWFNKILTLYPNINMTLYFFDIYDNPLCGKISKNQKKVYYEKKHYAEKFIKKYFTV